MNDVWLRSIRDSILALFLLGFAALAPSISRYVFREFLPQWFDVVLVVAVAGSVIAAFWFAAVALYLPWEDAGSERIARRSAQAEWEGSLPPKPKSAPEYYSRPE